MQNTSLTASIAALCCLTTLALPAQSSVTITELPTPSAASAPQGIDTAPDGSLWYCETAANKIAQLKPNQTTAEFPLPDGAPFIAKVAADGVWFTYSNRAAIGHLNPETGAVEQFLIPSGAAPFFIELAADGSKWFTETAGVGRLSPTGSISEWSFALEHPDDNIEQLGIDPFGNIWSAERNFDGAGTAGTNKVRRLNPATNVVSTFPVPTPGGNPAGIQTNADGTVWVSEYFANAIALLVPAVAPHTDAVVKPSTVPAGANRGAAARTTPTRTTGTTTRETASVHIVKPSLTPGWIEYRIPTGNAQAEDMRVDRFGRVWFEEDSGKLGVLNPFVAQFREYSVPSLNSGYYNIVLSKGEERLYFTEAGVFAPVATKVGYLPTGE